MEFAIVFFGLSFLAFAFVNYKSDEKTNKLLGERNEIERERLSIARAQNLHSVKRWEEHKIMKGLGDFKMKKLQEVAKTPPTIQPLIPNAPASKSTH